MRDRRYLYLDTSMLGVQVALATDGEVLHCERRMERRLLSSQLAATIEQALARVSWGLGDLHTVCVGRGPGSFTGIKVGLSWVLGLQAARPGLEVRSGCVFAYGVASILPEGRSTVLLPATATQGYAMGRCEGGFSLPRNWELGGLDADDLGSFLVLGSWPGVEKGLQDAGLAWSSLALEKFATIAFDQFCLSRPAGATPAVPRPLYLRASAAEEKRAAQGQANMEK